ncbi:DUF5979 domain-containing protein [Leucobacter ruminantium]|uniref:SD-repeat containing protein B domain-containing protein n=1 Tax=Leucobacter ruminantium TaxID=1289170 RepID=A0A939LU29_9MICO|nr:DUF5979 domain-containing protein [Leucobacter ruminantium]MBO1804839.1 hypothetical protein [Leucobacter ruminantium]
MSVNGARVWKRRSGGGVAAALALVLAVTLSPVGTAWANEETPAAETDVVTEQPGGETGATAGEKLAAEGEGSGETPSESGPADDVTNDPHAGHDAVGPHADYPNDPHDSYADCVEKSDAFGHGLCAFLEQTDGTPDWDHLDDANDNGVVRTNDLITYTVSVWSKGGHANGWFTLELPRGVVLESIPGNCLADSTLTPTAAQIGEPAVPLTGTSWQDLPAQTLVCNVGPQGDSVNKYDVTVKVRPEVPAGTELEATAHVQCSTGGDHFTNPVEADVVAEPRYDISKNSFNPLPDDGSDLNNGPINFDNARVFPCSFDASMTCTNIMYSLWISTPKGGKGVSPATELSFVEDLSPESFYGDPDITSHPNWSDDFRPRLKITNGTTGGRAINGVNTRSYPSTREKGVRFSGTPQLTPGPTEDPGDGRYEVRITDADLSAWTVPTTNDWGQPIPNTGGGVVNLDAIVEIPREALFALGTPNGDGSSTLRTVNSYTDFEVTDIAGQPNAADADTPRNNTRTADLRAARGQGDRGFGKSFVGIPNVTQNGTDINLSPDRPWQKPYVIGEGQLVGSRLQINRTRAAEADRPGMTALACDYWDPAQFTIEPGSYGPMTSPSNGEPVWNMTRNTGTTELRRVQYGVHDFTPDPALPGGVTSPMPSNCEDSRIIWYDSLDAVPTGRQAVGAVRVLVTLTPDAQGNAYANIGIALRSTTTQRPDNTVMPNYAGYRFDYHTVDDEPTWEEGLAMPSKGNGRQPINGDPGDYRADNHTGTFGDRVVSGALYSFIEKEVKNRTGEWRSSVQSFAGGQTADFRLIPRLYSVAPTARSERAVVEDCIPAGFTIESSNRSYSLVRPSTATLTCSADATYVSWDLGAHDVTTSGLTLPAIEYTVSISRFAATGLHRNTARVLAQGDPASSNPAAFPRVTDTLDVQIDASRGVFLEKSTLPDSLVTSANRPGQATNQLTSWEVRLGNLGFTGPGNVDIIDTLPTASGSEGNEFHGTMRFAGVSLTDPGTGDPSGARSTFYYTTAASFDENPEHASNWENGDVTAMWQPIPAAGLAPEVAAQVTGIRLMRTGSFDNGEQLAFRLDMTGVGNRAGDTYRNTTRAVAHQGLENLVMSSRANSEVVSSTIGDIVWWDLNRNGVQDDYAGQPEPGAAGVTVRLTGTDDLGNTISLETATNADGKYDFGALRPSSGAGYVVTFVAPNGATFTQKHAAAATPGTDSDATPATGASDAVVLAADSSNLDIDAGLLANGSLVIDKQFRGVGVQPFAGGDSLTFDVVCTFEGAPVYDDEVTLEVPAGASAVQSQPIAGLPAFAECTITETGAGKADEAAAPVTVTIPRGGQTQQVTASLTNYYSAGTIRITKLLEGGETAVEAAAERSFEILVTCQVERDGDRVDVHSQRVTFTGAGSKLLEDANGDPVRLPLGATCFAEETENGGASGVEIDHDSFDTGVEVVSGNPDRLQELAITALNTFELPEGSLLINKLLEGEGVKPFAGGDSLVFDVACTLDGETVFEQEVTLEAAAGATAVLSGTLGPIPASASCTITEIGHGDADGPAAPVTVEIPWNATAWTSGEATASLTNYYSVGTVALTKELAGEQQAISAVADTVFEIRVTCQVEETGPEGVVRSTLYSGPVKIRGGQTKLLVDDADEPRYLPLDARCFGVETDDGGAVKKSIDRDSFENAATVTSGSPDELQQLTITAVNTFECTEALCPKPRGPIPGLAATGAQLGGIASIAAALLAAGAILLIRRRREVSSGPHPGNL